jgi:ABC-type amino acid transport substrate-binding protein
MALYSVVFSRYGRRCLLLAVGLMLAAGLVPGRAAAQDASTLDHIRQSGVLRVGTGIYPPYTIQQPDGSVTGIEASLLEKLAKRLHAKLQYIVVGFDIIAAGIDTNKYDMTSGLLQSEGRMKVVEYASVPIYTVGQVWMVRSDNPKHFHTLADLNKPDTKIVVTTGGFDEIATTKYIPEAGRKSIPGVSIPQVVAEVISRRVDACGLETPVNTALYKGQYGDQIAFIPDTGHPVTEVPASWTFKKGDEKFHKYLNNFLGEQVKNGTLGQLKTKFLKAEYILQQ